MNKSKIEILLEKYSKNTCTEEEVRLLEQWLDELEITDQAYQDGNKKRIQKSKQKVLLRIWKRIDRTSPLVNNKQRILNRNNKIITLSSAALVILSLWIGIRFYIFSENANGNNSTVKNSFSLISPGNNKATLYLSSGKKMVLDEQRGVLVLTPNKIAYDDGTTLLQNQATASEPSTDMNEMVISTPIGGQYTVVLPDGSKVWLNAASNIHIRHNSFESHRDITLSGEAYFQVKSDKEHPFTVYSRDQKITVLGTSFNVSAYDDDNVMKTTLVEGKVAIDHRGTDRILTPGQQMRITEDAISVVPVSLRQITAWKDGLFSFNGDDLPSALRQLSRWYNFKISYQGPVPNVQITGDIYRNSDIHEVLEVLSNLGVHGEIDGDRLIVKSKPTS